MPIFTSLSCRTRAFESLPFATWRSKHILVFKTFLETPRIRFKIFTKTTPLIYFLAGTEAQKFWLSRENLHFKDFIHLLGIRKTTVLSLDITGCVLKRQYEHHHLHNRSTC